jgi:quercetin dioxygenase-like cupin family protein
LSEPTRVKTPTSVITTILEQEVDATERPLVTMQMIELDPGSPGAPKHLHPGPVFGYVLEGELLFQCEGMGQHTYKAGDVFWEPGGEVVHLLAANPNPDAGTKFLVLCVGRPGEPVTVFID